MIASRADGGRRRAWESLAALRWKIRAGLGLGIVCLCIVAAASFRVVVHLNIDVFRAAKARGDPFRVVITDLGMPYVDGRQVSEEVKAISAGTPVILLTGWGQRLLATDVPPSVDCVLSKPPTGRGLRSALAMPPKSPGK
jgi:CheY-like chemotaxis protein